MTRSAVQDTTTDYRFNFVDKSAVSSELAALHRVSDQLCLLRFGELLDESPVIRELLDVIRSERSETSMNIEFAALEL